jgi:tetratricopeptide (TPR) repeat protein
VANQLANIGLVYRDQGGLQAALRALEEALAIFREIGHQPGVAKALGHIGPLYEQLGDREAADRARDERAALMRPTAAAQ